MCEVLMTMTRNFSRARKKDGCICRLPFELLQIIVNYLSILDYFSICVVSKCWRSLFKRCLPCVPKTGEEETTLPWFVPLRRVLPPPSIYRMGSEFYTTGELGDLSTERTYRLNIPELCGTRFLVSRHGWLLLFSSETSALFFFSPFSRARIDLPPIDVAKLTNPMFDFSASPTSPDCMVFAISCEGDFHYRTFTCQRGNSNWKTVAHWYVCPGCIANTVYVKGVWYCFDFTGSFIVFNPSTSELKRVKNFDKRNCDSSCVSYVMKHGDQLSICTHNVFSEEISLCGPDIEREYRSLYCPKNIETLLRKSVKQALPLLQGKLAMDSFSLSSWCAVNVPDGGMEFYWHEVMSVVSLRCKDRGINRCPKGNCRIVAWFSPTWADSSLSLKWA
ncbi:F-box protein At3g56470-like [Silene latifolia]|uniref:F-box protein At3g56470-like n=1 Tax=Silene latifolia TaxID=37657 RepID=UPI003D77FA1D